MNPELIKQAYAYGAAVALQELGFNAQQAQAGGVKLASEKMAEGEEEGGMHPALAALLGGGAGALGGAALGAGSAFIPGLRGGRGLNKLLGKPMSAAQGGGTLAGKVTPDALFKNKFVRKHMMNKGEEAANFLPTLQDAYLRGMGGAGVGALGGGLAGGSMAGE